jgi:NAD(P)-dependent dehydrogenase (short-subunit alcohol dehydrogenase family)
VFGVRFWGALIVAKHAEKVLPAGGSLTLTGGMLAHRPTKNSFVVTAMAGGIEHVTQGLAVELAPIRVNCVCLGVIRTGIYDSMPEEQRDELIARWTARQPIPRAGKPEEAAEAYLYSMRAGYTTGQVLYVEGGLLLSN